MIHFEREVFDPVLIEEMLKQFQHVNIAMNDEDGYPYVVPVNYGFEIKNEKLLVYVHCMKRGKKVDLLRKDPRVPGVQRVQRFSGPAVQRPPARLSQCHRQRRDEACRRQRRV